MLTNDSYLMGNLYHLNYILQNVHIIMKSVYCGISPLNVTENYSINQLMDQRFNTNVLRDTEILTFDAFTDCAQSVLLCRSKYTD